MSRAEPRGAERDSRRELADAMPGQESWLEWRRGLVMEAIQKCDRSVPLGEVGCSCSRQIIEELRSALLRGVSFRRATPPESPEPSPEALRAVAALQDAEWERLAGRMTKKRHAMRLSANWLRALATQMEADDG